MDLTYKLIFFSIAPVKFSTFARCEESHLLLIYLLCHIAFGILWGYLLKVELAYWLYNPISAATLFIISDAKV